MNRFNKIVELHKFAVNNENQALRDAFMEHFHTENPRKAAAIADQWYAAYFETEEYKRWVGLPNLADVISVIREARPVQRERPDAVNNGKILLSEKYPKHASDFGRLNASFLSWARSRWADGADA